MYAHTMRVQCSSVSSSHYIVACNNMHEHMMMIDDVRVYTHTCSHGLPFIMYIIICSIKFYNKTLATILYYYICMHVHNVTTHMYIHVCVCQLDHQLAHRTHSTQHRICTMQCKVISKGVPGGEMHPPKKPKHPQFSTENTENH